MMVILSVPDDGYSRNAQCALNLISTFLLQTINHLCTKVASGWPREQRGYTG